MNADGFSVQSGGVSARSVGRGAVLFLLPVSAYIIGLLPVLYLYVFLTRLIPVSGLLYFVFLGIVLVFCFIFFILFEVFVPGLYIRLLNLRVDEGEYELSIANDGFFHHLLFFALYRPSLSLVGVFPLVPVRMAFLRLVGLQIGKDSLVAGTELIDEPFAVTIGDHSLVGGYAKIYTHLSFKKMVNKKVRIGNNCFIGNSSVIFPGVTIQDDVTVQPGSVVPSDQVLEKGGVYQGNPAIRVSS
jgi:hypothetical protein